MGETNPETLREKEATKQTAVDTLLSRVEDLDKKNREEREEAVRALRERIDALEADAAARKAYHVQEKQERPVSPARICSALAYARMGESEPWKRADAEYEYDVIRGHRDEERKRLQQWGLETMGGFWVPEEYLGSEFADNLRAEVTIFRLGARELPVNGAPVIIPTKTSSSRMHWVAETGAGTISTLNAGQIKLTPHKGMVLVPLSNELRLLSNPAVEGMVNADIAATIGLGVEAAALRGAGSAGEPLGIKGTPNVGVETTTSLNVTNASLYINELENDNALMGRLGWFMHPRPWATYRGKYRTKHPELMGIASAGPGAAFPETWCGYPVARSTNVRAASSSTTDVYFADWSQLLVARWGGVSFAVSTEAYDGTNNAWTQDLFFVRATTLVDIGLRHPQSFCYNASVTD